MATKKKKNFIPLIIILIVIGVILFGITSCVSRIKKAMENLSFYESYTVEEQNLSEHISVSGSIASDSITNESTELVGVKVKKVYVQVGDSVDKGDTLVEYDVSSLREQLSKAQSNEKSAKSGLQKAYDDAVAARSSALGTIEKEINSLKDLLTKVNSLKNNPDKINIFMEMLDKCDPSSDNYDGSYEYCSLYPYVAEIDISDPSEINSALNVELNVLINKTLPDSIKELSTTYNEKNEELSKAVEEAKAELNADSEFTAQIKELKEQINASKVKASKSGTITAVNVVEGSMQATAGVVATIQGTKQYKVTVPINEVDILKLKKGMKATITCIATGKETYTGYVDKIVTMSSTTDEFGNYSSGASYSAEVVLNDTDTDLLVGMSAKVNILLSEEKTVIAIPYDAYINYNSEYDYVNLLTKNEDGKNYTVTRQKITVGEEKDYFVEVTEGLNEGDRILLYQNDIAEGTQINAQLLDMFDGMDLN